MEPMMTNQITSPSRLLMQEPPLVIQPTLATLLGLHEAIILQQINYWISKPKAHERDGRRWVYNSYAEWQTQFPFLSADQIKRAILHLEKNGVLLSANYNDLAVNRTKWYSIDYEALATFQPSGTSAPSLGTNAPPSGASAPSSISKDYTETSSEITTCSVENSSAAPEVSPAPKGPNQSLRNGFSKGFEALRAIPEYSPDGNLDQSLIQFLQENAISDDVFFRAATSLAANWPSKTRKPRNPWLLVRSYCLNAKKWDAERVTQISNRVGLSTGKGSQPAPTQKNVPQDDGEFLKCKADIEERQRRTAGHAKTGQ
jgi:hypothetical protein